MKINIELGKEENIKDLDNFKMASAIVSLCLKNTFQCPNLSPKTIAQLILVQAEADEKASENWNKV